MMPAAGPAEDKRTRSHVFRAAAADTLGQMPAASTLASLLDSPPRRPVARALWNIRQGRMQRLLSLATAVSVPPLALEVYMEHFKGSFGDKWMWTPIVLTPPLTAAGVAGFFSERAARTWLPLLSGLYALDGIIGMYTHVRGVAKRPGGFDEPTYNLIMGPPLLAPGSLTMVGAFGLLAPLVRRER